MIRSSVQVDYHQYNCIVANSRSSCLCKPSLNVLDSCPVVFNNLLPKEKMKDRLPICFRFVTILLTNFQVNDPSRF